MSDIKAWTLTAAGNNAAPPDGLPEGMQQKDFNDSVRENMRAVRQFYDAPDYADINRGFVVSRVAGNQLRITGVDLTTYYASGLRVRSKPSAGSFVSHIVSSSSFSAGDTLVTVTGSLVQVSTDVLEVFFLRTIREAAFKNAGNLVGDVAVNTSAAALGSAAYKNQSNTVGDVPVHSATGPLLAGAYKAVSNTVGDLVVHAQTGPLAALAYKGSPGQSISQKAANQAIGASTAETAIATFTGVALPGTPDGVKRYRYHATVQINNDSGANNQMSLRLRIGTNGDLTDSAVVIVKSDLESSSFTQLVIAGFVNVPAASTKATLSIQGSNGNYTVGGGAAPFQSWLEMSEVL